MSGERAADVTATVAVRVAAAPEIAFDLFTREIDSWWRRGPRFRHATGSDARISIEPRRDGAVRETWHENGAERHFELGRVTAWAPPHRLCFTWRNATFAPAEDTDVEVTFAAVGAGTLVTVRHRGWTRLRPDHPARHGMDDTALSRSVGLWWGDQLTALRERALDR